MTGFHLIDTELLPYILVGKVHWKIIFGNLGVDELHKKSVLHFIRLKHDRPVDSYEYADVTPHSAV